MSLPSWVLLDRDGVLNRDRPDYVASTTQWVWQPGAREALARLTQSSLAVVVLTNQAGIGHGRLGTGDLEAVHGRMRAEAEAAGGRIDGVFFCPHTEDEGCDCRKPRPGLLNRAAKHFGQPLAGTPFVGDARRDLEAAVAVGARPVLVRTGKGRATEVEGVPPGTAVFDDLPEFVDALLKEGASC